MYIFNPNLEHQIRRADEQELIRDLIVLFLTDNHLLGYPTYPGVTKKEVTEVLKPRVLKLTHYIYTTGICHITFFNSVTEKELIELVS